MEIITSVNNPLIKEIKKQKVKGLLFLDTPKLIDEAIKSGVKFTNILVEQNSKFDFLQNQNITVVSQNIIDSLTSVKTNKGIIAVAENYSKDFQYPNNNFLVLDGLQDPGNIGTLIRSALGANFCDVYLINCTSINNDKLIRSSMGAVFNVNCYELARENFIHLFNKNDLKLYCCDMNGKDVFDFKPNEKLGVVIGNEGNGVTKEIRGICFDTIKIPMANNLESLNAGVSGSIIMYQIAYGR